MKQYEQLKGLKEEGFRRLTGVKPKTLNFFRNLDKTS
jgi:hypothetical protein